MWAQSLLDYWLKWFLVLALFYGVFFFVVREYSLESALFFQYSAKKMIGSNTSNTGRNTFSCVEFGFSKLEENGLGKKGDDVPRLSSWFEIWFSGGAEVMDGKSETVIDERG